MKAANENDYKLALDYISYNEKTGEFFWKKHKPYTTVKPFSKVKNCYVKGYLTITFNCKIMYLHKLAYFMYYKTIPKYVNHINHIKNDNRILNLQASTSTRYNAKPRIDGKLKLPGITETKEGYYLVRVGINNVRYYLGTYTTKNQAIYARDLGRK